MLYYTIVLLVAQYAMLIKRSFSVTLKKHVQKYVRIITESLDMSRVFAYCRVSTLEQNTENQRREIAAAGFRVEQHRIIEEKISGSVAAMERREFVRLMDKLESGDIIVVTKLDRLGRNAIDIRKTVESLAEMSVKVHCLALGGVDLPSAAGKMTMQEISAVAEFERDLLIERPQSGLARARSVGKRLGRPAALNEDQKRRVNELISTGVSISAIAREFGTTRQTILRAKVK